MASKKPTKRDLYLTKKYGITEATYFKMAAVHDGACWICLRKPSAGKTLNVDHEHPRKKVPGSGGQVRGLLCFFCNKYMIGRRRAEHAILFERAAAYLRLTVDWRKVI